MSRPLHPVLLLLGVSLACQSVSCSKDGRKPVFPVEGKILVGKDRQPATGALIVFHPIDEPNDPNKPRAHVGDDGSFTLTTYTQNDGAPAGEYAVTIEWPTPKKTPYDREGPDRLGGRYRNPKESKIHFTIEAQPNSLPPIELP